MVVNGPADDAGYGELAENYRPNDIDPGDVVEELQSLTDREQQVYQLLEEGPMTPQEIQDRSDIPDRTTRDALETLQEIGAVYTFPSLLDGRKELYHITVDTEDDPYDAEDL